MIDDLDIRILPDTALRIVTPEITEWDDPGSKDRPLRDLVLAMGAVCRMKGGFGLAANQIGRATRVFILMESDVPPEEAGVYAFCNPEITYRSDEVKMETEGCLSLPDLGIDVERAVEIRLRFRDTYGEEREEEYFGWDARVIQHETDHLNGRLTIDYVEPRQRYRMLVAWREHVVAGSRYRHAA